MNALEELLSTNHQSSHFISSDDGSQHVGLLNMILSLQDRLKKLEELLESFINKKECLLCQGSKIVTGYRTKSNNEKQYIHSSCPNCT